MKKFGFLLFFILFVHVIVATPLKVVRLTCEHRQNPLGIDLYTPQLSWQLDSERRGAAQTAYEVWVATDPRHLETGNKLVWKSGKIPSTDNVCMERNGLVGNSHAGEQRLDGRMDF